MARMPRVRTLLRILEDEGLLWLANEVRQLAGREEPDLTEGAVALLRRESDDGRSPSPREWPLAEDEPSAALPHPPDFDACLDHVTRRVMEMSRYLESIQEMAGELGISSIRLGDGVEGATHLGELVSRLRQMVDLIDGVSPR